MKDTSFKVVIALLAVLLVSAGFAADRVVVDRGERAPKKAPAVESPEFPIGGGAGTYNASPYVESTVGCGVYATIAGAPGAIMQPGASTIDDFVEVVPITTFTLVIAMVIG